VSSPYAGWPTVRALAEHLGLSVRQVRRLIHAQTWNHVRVSQRRILIDPADVERYVAERTGGPGADPVERRVAAFLDVAPALDADQRARVRDLLDAAGAA
jgi:excisionase family DNA binding protein